MPKTLILSFSLFITLLLACSDHRQTSFVSQIINSDNGVSPDTLDLIYNGPKGFTLEYFPNAAIQAARVKECQITQQDSNSARVAKKISFDQNGNIVKDENNFFAYWFEGTVRGTYEYLYDSSNNLLQVKGIPQEDRKDSIMTIYNYTQRGQLFSRDRYEFAKKLKPGADRHLPQPTDFEKYPTWNKLNTYKFSHNSNTIVVETIYEGKIVEKEKYIFQFDSLNRLQTTTKYRDASFVEVTHYTYEANSIIGNLSRKMNDGKDRIYNSKIIIDNSRKQIEKIFFKDNDTERVKMTTTYNADGTISNIKYNNTLQFFKYSYY